MLDDQELVELLKKWIDNIKYEDEKIAKVRKEEYRIVQAAAMRALRKEAERICHLDNLKKAREAANNPKSVK